MDTQTLFNTVATHLLTQSAKSISNRECRYRGDDGLSCAAGCLIPDDQYDQTLEGSGVGHRKVLAVLEGIVEPEDIDLLRDLQLVHDYDPVRQWWFLLAKVADDYQLELPTIMKENNSIG